MLLVNATMCREPGCMRMTGAVAVNASPCLSATQIVMAGHKGARPITLGEKTFEGSLVSYHNFFGPIRDGIE